MALSENTPQSYALGERNSITVRANTRIFEGACVGISDISGAADNAMASFPTHRYTIGGFALREADNRSGMTGGGTVEVYNKGAVQIPVPNAGAADIGNPVYASDNNTFTFSPVDTMFVGFIKRVVSSGVAIVEFDSSALKNPYQDFDTSETISGAKTLDIQDNGKLFWVDSDAVITLPAVATPINCKIVNGGARGTVEIAISPNSNDRIQGPDLPGAEDKDLINTKATARRGDFATLVTGDANGPIASQLRGTWATEA